MEKMDRRDAAVSAGKRTGRRTRRRRRMSGPGRVLFSISAGLFVMALVLAALAPPPAQAGSEEGRGLPDSAGVTAPPLSRGEEPVLPSEEDWRLVLVNAWNPLPEDETVTLKELSNGLRVDERCYPDLQAMMDACRAAGLSPVICSAYRSYEKQEELYWNKVDRLLAQGYAQTDAEEEAGREVARPGTSEHQLGLAVDIVDLDNQNLDETQKSTAVQQWLMAHSWEYGFILRYPGGKSEITGIIYEPWHYRYVGRDAAAEIYEQGVCLEEYLAP